MVGGSFLFNSWYWGWKMYPSCCTTDKKDKSLEWHHATFPEKRMFKPISSAWKVMFFEMQKGWFWYSLFFVFQPVTQICTFKLLIPCRSISEEFDLTKILMNSSFSITTYHHTHKFGNTGINHKSWTVLPYPPNSPDLASWELYLFGALTRCHPWERFGSDDVLEEV